MAGIHPLSLALPRVALVVAILLPLPCIAPPVVGEAGIRHPQAEADEATPSALPDAAASYYRALLQRPDSAAVMERFVDAWLDDGKDRIQIAAFLESEVENPGDDPANQGADRRATLELLARYHLFQGDPSAATAAWHRLLELNPDNPAAHYEVARLALAESDLPAALKGLQRAAEGLEAALRAEPESRALQDLAETIARLRGRTLIRAGRSDEGLEILRELLAAHPDDELLHEDIVELLVIEGLFDEAITSLGELIERLAAGDAYQATVRRIRLGAILHQAGRHDEGLAEWRRALGRCGHGSWLEREILTRIDQHFRRRDDLGGLDEELDRLIAAEPDRVALRTVRARLLTDRGRDDEALAAWREVLARTPGDRDLRFEFVEALRRLRRDDEALEQVQAIVARSPGDLTLLPMLADFQHRAGQHDLAGHTLVDYLERAQAGEAERLRIARLLAGYGLPEHAAGVYRRLLEDDPASPNGRDAFAHFLSTRDETSRARAIEIWMDLARDGDRQRLLATVRTLASRDSVATAYAALRGRLDEFRADALYLDELCQLALRLGEEESRAVLPLALTRVELAGDSRELAEAITTVEQLARLTDSTAELLGQLENAAPATLRCLHAVLAAAAADSSGPAAELLTDLAAGIAVDDTAPPEEADVLFALDTLVAIHQRFDEWHAAARLLERRVVQHQGQRQAHLLETLAFCLEKANRTGEALEWNRKWRTLTPENARAWLNEARLQRQRGDADAALNLLRQAARKFPERTELRDQLARWCLDSGRIAEAERLYWQLYESAESDRESLRRVADLTRLAVGRGNPQALVERFRERQRSNSQSPRPWLALAEVLRLTGDPEGQREALLAAARLEPENLQLLRSIASLEADEGRFDAALETLDRAIQLDRTGGSREQRVRLLFQVGRPAEALADLDEAMASGGGASSMPIADPIAVVQALAALGEWNAAADFLASARDTAPDDADLRWLQAVVLAESGRHREAAENFVAILREALDAPEGEVSGIETTPQIVSSQHVQISRHQLSGRQTRQLGFSSGAFHSRGSGGAILVAAPRRFQSGAVEPAIATTAFPPRYRKLSRWTLLMPDAWSYRGRKAGTEPLYALSLDPSTSRGPELPLPAGISEQIAWSVAHLLRLMEVIPQPEADALGAAMEGAGLESSALVAARFAQRWQEFELLRWTNDFAASTNLVSWRAELAAAIDDHPELAMLWISWWGAADREVRSLDVAACQVLKRELGAEVAAGAAFATLLQRDGEASGPPDPFATPDPDGETFDYNLLAFAVATIAEIDSLPESLVADAARTILSHPEFAVLAERGNASIEKLTVLLSDWRPEVDADIAIRSDSLRSLLRLAEIDGDAERWIDRVKAEQERYEESASKLEPASDLAARDRRWIWWEALQNHELRPIGAAVSEDPFGATVGFLESVFPPPGIDGISPAILNATSWCDGEKPAALSNIAFDDEEKKSLLDNHLDQHTLLRCIVAANWHDREEVERCVAELSGKDDPTAQLLAGAWKIVSIDGNPPGALDQVREAVKLLEAAATHPQVSLDLATTANLLLIWTFKDRVAAFEPAFSRIVSDAATRLLSLPDDISHEQWQAVTDLLVAHNLTDLALRSQSQIQRAAARTTVALSPNMAGRQTRLTSTIPLPNARQVLMRVQMDAPNRDRHPALIRYSAAVLPQIACRAFLAPGFEGQHDEELLAFQEIGSILDQGGFVAPILDTSRPGPNARRLDHVRFAALCLGLQAFEEARATLHGLLFPPVPLKAVVERPDEMRLLEAYLLAAENSRPVEAAEVLAGLLTDPGTPTELIGLAQEHLSSLIRLTADRNHDGSAALQVIVALLEAITPPEDASWPLQLMERAAARAAGEQKPEPDDLLTMVSLDDKVSLGALHLKICERLARLPGFSDAVYLHLHGIGQRNPSDLQRERHRILELAAREIVRQRAQQPAAFWSFVRAESLFPSDGGGEVDPFAPASTSSRVDWIDIDQLPTSWGDHPPIQWLCESAWKEVQPERLEAIVDLWTTEIPAARDGKSHAAQNAETLRRYVDLWRMPPDEFAAGAGEFLATADVEGDPHLTGERLTFAFDLLNGACRKRSDIDQPTAMAEILLHEVARRPHSVHREELRRLLAEQSQDSTPAVSVDGLLESIVEAALGKDPVSAAPVDVPSPGDGTVLPTRQGGAPADSPAERQQWLADFLAVDEFPRSLIFKALGLQSELGIDQHGARKAHHTYLTRFDAPFEGGDLVALADHSPLLAAAADLDPIPSPGLASGAEGGPRTFIGALLRQMRFRNVRTAIGELESRPATLGRDLLLALLDLHQARPPFSGRSEDLPPALADSSSPMLAAFAHHLDTLKNLPEERQADLALLALDLIEAAPLNSPIDARQRNVLRWLSALDGFPESEPTRKVLPRRIAQLALLDTSRAVSHFTASVQSADRLIDDATRAALDHAHYLLPEVFGFCRPPEAVALFARLSRDSDLSLNFFPSLAQLYPDHDWRSASERERTFTERPFGETPQVSLLFDLASELDTCLDTSLPGEAMLALPILAKQMRELEDAELAALLDESLPEPDGSIALSTAMLGEIELGLRLETVRRLASRDPEVWQTHGPTINRLATARLADPDVPLGHRLIGCQFFAQTFRVSEPSEALAQAMVETVVETLEGNTPVPALSLLVEAIEHLSADNPTHRALLVRLAAAAAAEGKLHLRSGPLDSATAERLANLMLDLELVEPLEHFVLQHASAFELLDRYPFYLRCVRCGAFPVARIFLETHGEMYLNRAAGDQRYDLELHERVEPFAALFEEPAMRWLARATLAKLDDASPLPEGLPDRPQRLAGLANDFAAYAGPGQADDGDFRRRLLWLSQRPSTALLVADQLLAFADEFWLPGLESLARDQRKQVAELLGNSLRVMVARGDEAACRKLLDSAATLADSDLQRDIEVALFSAARSWLKPEMPAPSRAASLAAIEVWRHLARRHSIPRDASFTDSNGIAILANALTAHVLADKRDEFAMWLETTGKQDTFLLMLQEDAGRVFAEFDWLDHDAVEEDFIADVLSTPLTVSSTGTPLRVLANAWVQAVRSAQTLNDLNLRLVHVIDWLEPLPEFVDHPGEAFDLLLKIVDLVDHNSGSGWISVRQDGSNLTTRLITNHCRKGGWNRIGRLLELLASDDHPDLIYTWSAYYGIGEKFKATLAANDHELASTLAAVEAELDYHGPAALLLPVMLECASTIERTQLAEMLTYADSRAGDLTAQFATAVRVLLAARSTETVEPGDWLPKLLATLDDDGLRLSWRLSLARSTIQQLQSAAPRELVMKSAEILVEVLQDEAAHIGAHAAVVVESYLALPADTEWQSIAESLVAAWHPDPASGDDTADKAKPEGPAVIDDPGVDICLARLELLLAAGRDDQAYQFLDQRAKALNHQPRCLGILVRQRDFETARAYLATLGAGFEAPQWSDRAWTYDPRYDARLAEAADAFFATLDEPVEKLLARAILAAAPDPLEANRSAGDAALPDRATRLEALRVEIESLDLGAETRRQLGLWLERESP